MNMHNQTTKWTANYPNKQTSKQQNVINCSRIKCIYHTCLELITPQIYSKPKFIRRKSCSFGLHSIKTVLLNFSVNTNHNQTFISRKWKNINQENLTITKIDSNGIWRQYVLGSRTGSQWNMFDIRKYLWSV